jgi:hypothetical protein
MAGNGCTGGCLGVADKAWEALYFTLRLQETAQDYRNDE